jgi:hypothetical protein
MKISAEAENSNFDVLEMVVEKAHEICNKILLFEAVCMKEDEIRLVLDRHHIFDREIQRVYLELVREYNEHTSCEKKLLNNNFQTRTGAKHVFNNRIGNSSDVGGN